MRSVDEEDVDAPEVEEAEDMDPDFWLAEEDTAGTDDEDPAPLSVFSFRLSLWRLKLSMSR